MQMAPIILYPSFIWGCPSCMTWNVQAPIPAEMTPDELSDAKEQGGSGDRDDYTTTPDQVKCRLCSCEYEAIHHAMIEAIDGDEGDEQSKE